LGWLSVLALRCTAKLLARVGPPQEPTAPSTTILGDWYAAPLNLGHARYVLAISEHSRLPVLMRGRDLKHLPANFPDALAAVLWGLGISAGAIVSELEAMEPAAIAKTNSRSHLGTLNDFSFMLRYQLHGQTDLDLVQTALELAHTPVGPLRPTHFPDRLTRQLLEG
jgi:hypothetical protein